MTEKAKRPGGNQRKAQTRDAVRAAARGPEYESRWLADYITRVGPPPFDDADAAFGWLLNALLFAADETMRDPALPPEQRVQRLTVVAPQLVKAIDPARLGARLRALELELDRNALDDRHRNVTDAKDDPQ